MIDLDPISTEKWFQDAENDNRFRLGVVPRNYQYPLLSELYADYSRFQAKNERLPLSKQKFRQDLEILYSITLVTSTGRRVKGIIHSTPETDTKPSLKLPSSTTEAIDLIQSLISHSSENPLHFLMKHYEIKTKDLPTLKIITDYLTEEKNNG